MATAVNLLFISFSVRRFTPVPGFMGALRALVTGAPGARRHELAAHIAAAPSSLDNPYLPAESEIGLYNRILVHEGLLLNLLHILSNQPFLHFR